MGKRTKDWASMKGHFQREGILMIAFPAVLVIAGLVITILVQTLRGGRAFH
jgi:F0F1-type ATP synthase membrane subunit c/vacuolar-type H+-ATPase subunit K